MNIEMRRVLQDEVKRMGKQTSSQNSWSGALQSRQGLDHLHQVIDRHRQVLAHLRPHLRPHRQNRKRVLAALVVCFSWQRGKHWECT